MWAVIFLMTYVIALGSFPHVVAGSVDTFYLVAKGVRSWGQCVGGFIAPTLIGNILGGPGRGTQSRPGDRRAALGISL